ncbi:MAG: hypothetical protein ACRDNT_18425 [Streptosporangiaceae bacterium]
MARSTPEQAVRRRAWSQAARSRSRAAADRRACPGQTPGSRPPQDRARRRRLGRPCTRRARHQRAERAGWRPARRG